MTMQWERELVSFMEVAEVVREQAWGRGQAVGVQFGHWWLVHGGWGTMVRERELASFV